MAQLTADEKEHRAFVRKLRADLRGAAQGMTRAECRTIVDSYYQIQKYRTKCANMARAAEEAGEKAELLTQRTRSEPSS